MALPVIFSAATSASSTEKPAFAVLEQMLQRQQMLVRRAAGLDTILTGRRLAL